MSWRIEMDQVYYVEKEHSLKEMPLQFSAHIQEAWDAKTTASAHIHDFIEILYALKGKYRILLNNKEYYYSEGDMVLINSNEIHNIIALSEGLNQYMVLKFKPDMLYTTSQSFFEIKYVMPFILKESVHQKIFKKEEIEKTVIPRLIEAIYRESIEKKYGYELAIRANIFNLFLFILRKWNAQNEDLNIHPDISPEMTRRLSDVFDYINTHYQEDITARAMAEKCHMSYSYFSRTFMRIMKKSFKDYLNFVRISKAEKLLGTSNGNITEIALAVGFSTSSYFIRQFRLYKGVSPKQFQMRFLKE